MTFGSSSCSSSTFMSSSSEGSGEAAAARCLPLDAAVAFEVGALLVAVEGLALGAGGRPRAAVPAVEVDGLGGMLTDALIRLESGTMLTLCGSVTTVLSGKVVQFNAGRVGKFDASKGSCFFDPTFSDTDGPTPALQRLLGITKHF